MTACSDNSACARGEVCVDGACIDDPNAGLCGGFAGFTCETDEWCDYDETTGTACGVADGLGECKPRPEACIQVFDPVCGCDGMTYSNSCVANAAGVDVFTTGACAF